MSAKQFFKSVSFKCIVSLLCILLVCGVFLTVAYGFLEVTDGERLQRAISKIYDSGLTITIYGKNDGVIDSSETDPKGLIDEPVTYGDAEIQQAYKITFAENSEINYLVLSKGTGGYSGGSVTCYVAVKVDSTGVTGIGNVSIDSNVGQSFIGKITDSFLSSFSEGYTDGIIYEPREKESKDDINGGYLSSGATKSSTAIDNAVNGAISYVKTEIFGETSVNPYENFSYTDYINTDKTTYAVDGDKVIYSVVTKSKSLEPTAFTLTIEVGAAKTITMFEIVTNGSTTESYEGKMYDVNNFVGKDLSYFTDMLGDNLTYPGSNAGTDISTGATQSSFICAYAGAFAVANYDNCIAANAEGGNS